MNAQQAYEATYKCESLENVFDKIKEAAKEGSNSVRVGRLSADTLSKVKSLGYDTIPVLQGVELAGYKLDWQNPDMSKTCDEDLFVKIGKDMRKEFNERSIKWLNEFSAKYSKKKESFHSEMENGFKVTDVRPFSDLVAKDDNGNCPAFDVARMATDEIGMENHWMSHTVDLDENCIDVYFADETEGVNIDSEFNVDRTGRAICGAQNQLEIFQYLLKNNFIKAE